MRRSHDEHAEAMKVEREEETAEPQHGSEKLFHLHERLDASFERRFTLPQEADLSTAKASLANGVLAIHVQRAGVPKPRKLRIGT
jgi:HSP20 family molecular chaperone IbpA